MIILIILVILCFAYDAFITFNQESLHAGKEYRIVLSILRMIIIYGLLITALMKIKVQENNCPEFERIEEVFYKRK